MMVCNPLEGQPCEFTAEDLFFVDQGSCAFLQPKRNELLEGALTGCGIDAYLYLLRSIQIDIVWKVQRSLGDYQGDCFFIGESSDHKIYFCQTGYGSCSGCDLYLDAIEIENIYIDRPYQKMAELQEDLKRALRRFDSDEELVRWLLSSQSEGTEYWSGSGRNIPANSWLIDDMAEEFDLGQPIRTEFVLNAPDRDELLKEQRIWTDGDDRLDNLYELHHREEGEAIIRRIRQRWPVDRSGLHYFLNARLPPEVWWTVVQETADSIQVQNPRFPEWSMTLPRFPGHHWEYFEQVTLRELEQLENLRVKEMVSCPAFRTYGSNREWA